MDSSRIVTTRADWEIESDTAASSRRPQPPFQAKLLVAGLGLPGLQAREPS
jgi:hypothetical protein